MTIFRRGDKVRTKSTGSTFPKVFVRYADEPAMAIIRRLDGLEETVRVDELERFEEAATLAAPRVAAPRRSPTHAPKLGMFPARAKGPAPKRRRSA